MGGRGEGGRTPPGEGMGVGAGLQPALSHLNSGASNCHPFQPQREGMDIIPGYLSEYYEESIEGTPYLLILSLSLLGGDIV